LFLNRPLHDRWRGCLGSWSRLLLGGSVNYFLGRFVRFRRHGSSRRSQRHRYFPDWRRLTWRLRLTRGRPLFDLSLCHRRFGWSGPDRAHRRFSLRRLRLALDGWRPGRQVWPE
jgi:hypothetical protein